MITLRSLIFRDLGNNNRAFGSKNIRLKIYESLLLLKQYVVTLATTNTIENDSILIGALVQLKTKNLK